MADISAEKVRELREKTGAGLMDCKKALLSTSGDLEAAMELLRKEGVIKAGKKAGRATSEGLVGVSVAPDRRSGAIVEVNCETDFVARTDQFIEFVNSIAEMVVQNKSSQLDNLLSSKLKGQTVQEVLAGLISKLGENMSIRRVELLQAKDGEVVGGYIHAGSKIGVLVQIQGSDINEDLIKDVAMHAAAMSPRFLDRTKISAAIIEKEREIAKATPDMANKPANLVDKIVDGKINRFFSESCFVDQVFIKDPAGKQSVKDYVNQKSKGASIVNFSRFQVGEEIA